MGWWNPNIFDDRVFLCHHWSKAWRDVISCLCPTPSILAASPTAHLASMQMMAMTLFSSHCSRSPSNASLWNKWSVSKSAAHIHHRLVSSVPALKINSHPSTMGPQPDWARHQGFRRLVANGVNCMSNYSELSTYHECGNIFPMSCTVFALKEPEESMIFGGLRCIFLKSFLYFLRFEVRTSFQAFSNFDNFACSYIHFVLFNVSYNPSFLMDFVLDANAYFCASPRSYTGNEFRSIDRSAGNSYWLCSCNEGNMTGLLPVPTRTPYLFSMSSGRGPTPTQESTASSPAFWTQ